MKRAKKKQTNRVQNQSDHRNKALPFVEHLYELRKRLFYVVLSIGAWSAAAYFVQQHIVRALLRPADSQQFIYTSVGGGIDFLFRICLYTGIVFSIPVVMFQVLKYLEPLIKKDAMRFMFWGSAISGVLAIAGMAFGYFIGLPSALHFLLHQFTSNQIQPLLTIQSYMSFVTLYMLASALLFQGPLLLVLINRIKPLKPSKLLGLERWVILIAFILGGIINPSPRWQDQVLLAGPMIIAYQIGVILVWLTNRRGRKPAHIMSLHEKDEALRAERLAKFQEARAALRRAQPHAAPAAVIAQATPSAVHAAIPPQPVPHASKPTVRTAPIAAPMTTAVTTATAVPAPATPALTPSITARPAPRPHAVRATVGSARPAARARLYTASQQRPAPLMQRPIAVDISAEA
jgi:sec-independent protein translocase protein TatC